MSAVIRRLCSKVASKLQIRQHRQMDHGARLAELVGERRNVPSQTSYLERLALFEAAAQSCLDATIPVVMVEVGSYHGASSVLLAEAIRRSPRGGRLYCVDTWRNDAMSSGIQDTWGIFQRTTEPWGNVIVAVRGDSKTVELPFSEPIDLAFIDGDHTYEGCLADAQRFAPRLRDGGRLVLHDHAWYSGVAHVVGDLLRQEQWIIESVAANLIVLRKDLAFSSRHQPV